MSGNPKITPALANRVANFPRLCRFSPCRVVYYAVDGTYVGSFARYKDVAWDIINGRPTVVGHTVLVGDVVVHVGIGNTTPLHKSCTQCGKENL